MYYYLVPSHTTPGKKSVKIEIQPADNVSEYRLQLEEEQNTTWIAGNCFEITKNGNYHVEIKGIDQQVEQRSFTISFLGKRPAFDGGAGTQEDPFQISTLEQLNAIRLKLSGHYILTADIDLAQWGLVWIPIGKYVVGGEDLVRNRTFTGAIDGAGHRLSGLCCGPVWTSIEERMGFEPDDQVIATGFIGCSIGSIFRNLYLEKCQVSGFYGVGCLAGEAQNCRFENCHASGAVDGVYIAGLCSGQECHLKKCSFNGELSAESDAHGLCCDAITIYNCEVNAKISGTSAYGICAALDSKIQWCIVRGCISGRSDMGGICLSAGLNAKVYECICALEQVHILENEAQTEYAWNNDVKCFSTIDAAGERFYYKPELREYWNTKYRNHFRRENIKFISKKTAPDLDTADGQPITDEQLHDRAFLESVGWNFDGCWYMDEDGPHLKKGVCSNKHAR